MSLNKPTLKNIYNNQLHCKEYIKKYFLEDLAWSLESSHTNVSCVLFININMHMTSQCHENDSHHTTNLAILKNARLSLCSCDK